jgi:hypothetical protein
MTYQKSLCAASLLCNKKHSTFFLNFSYNYFMENLTTTQSVSIDVLQKELVSAKAIIAKQEELIKELTESKEEELKAVCHQLASPVQVISMSIEAYLMRKQIPSHDSLLRMQTAASSLVKIIEEIRAKRIVRLKSLEKDIIV